MDDAHAERLIAVLERIADRMEDRDEEDGYYRYETARREWPNLDTEAGLLKAYIASRDALKREAERYAVTVTAC